MAKYDWIEYVDGSSDQTVNLHHSVGFKGINNPDDVMLIQALIEYISKRAGMGPKTLGLGGDYKVPAVTGIMDNETYSAIGQFQIEWQRNLIIRRFDGRIDEAHYRGRKLNRGNLQVMSITLLHELAGDAALVTSDKTYIKDIEDAYPRLAHAFDMSLFDT